MAAGIPISQYSPSLLNGFINSGTNFGAPLNEANKALQQFKSKVDVTFAFFFTDGGADYPRQEEAPWKKNLGDKDNISFLRLQSTIRNNKVLINFYKNLNSPRCAYSEDNDYNRMYNDLKEFVGIKDKKAILK